MARPNGTVNLIRYRAAVRGLICGFAMQSGRCSQPLAGEELNAALAQPDAVVWLHFNLRIGQARDWIAGRAICPKPRAGCCWTMMTASASSAATAI